MPCWFCCTCKDVCVHSRRPCSDHFEPLSPAIARLAAEFARERHEYHGYTATCDLCRAAGGVR